MLVYIDVKINLGASVIKVSPYHNIIRQLVRQSPEAILKSFIVIFHFFPDSQRNINHLKGNCWFVVIQVLFLFYLLTIF